MQIEYKYLMNNYCLLSESNYKDYLKYLKNLPLNDSPEIFGLHENANMTYAQNETFAILDKLLLMQAKTGGGGGASQEEVCNKAMRAPTAVLLTVFFASTLPHTACLII